MAKRRTTPRSHPTPSTALVGPEIVEVPAGVFKNTCLALMDDVRAGRKEVVITKHGEVVARLVPPNGTAPSAFGFLRGALLDQGDLVSPDFDAWGDPE